MGGVVQITSGNGTKNDGDDSDHSLPRARAGSSPSISISEEGEFIEFHVDEEEGDVLDFADKIPMIMRQTDENEKDETPWKEGHHHQKGTSTTRRVLLFLGIAIIVIALVVLVPLIM